MLVLGIESSCDETAAAVVADGRRVLSNCIASQVALHQRYGGVVPEVASRAHVEAIIPMISSALSEAGVSLAEIDAFAVTRGPGLIGCLLVGMEAAKSLAVSQGKPLVAIQHIAGHLYSPFIGREVDAWGDSVGEPANSAPYIGLAISGGHSSVALVKSPLEFTILGETLDDAVGEAYDKVAKHLGLGYPGGPLLDRIAAEGNPDAFDFPRPLHDRPGYDFSFSGLKTSVARTVEKLGGAEAVAADPKVLADVCASFQSAAIDVLLERAKRAIKKHRLSRLAITGGVACNKGLRRALEGKFRDVQIALPLPEYCTDNAAMIAGIGGAAHAAGHACGIRINATTGLDIEAGVHAWQQ